MAIRAKMKAAFKSWGKAQIANQSAVIPEHRWAQKENRFYLNCEAGQISYRPKSYVDLNRFRDRWINRFSQISNLQGRERTIALFSFYAEIRNQEKVRYRASVRTRAKGVAWGILNTVVGKL